MKITLVSAGTAVYGVLRIDGQHHSLAVGDTLTIDEPKPPPPPDPRFAVTPHLRDYWTKGPGSTTPRWPEQDRSTTMHDYDQPMPETVPAKNDPLDHLDDVIDDLDGELEGLAAALVTVLRPDPTTIQTDTLSGERVGPDDRSPRRQRIDMLSARIQRMTREMRTLHERIDL